MDNKKLTKIWESVNSPRAPLTTENIFKFAQKLIAARDAEWMACKLCELEGVDLRGNNQRIPVYAQPEEVK